MKRRRGFTLVEVLVVTAMLVTIGAVALRIVDETQRSASLISTRQAALQYCETAIQRIGADIQNAVDPVQAPLVDGESSAKPRYAAGELTLLTSQRGHEGMLMRWTVGQAESGDPPRKRLWRRFEPIAALVGNRPATPSSDDPGLLPPQGFTPQVSFGFAGEPQPSAEANYAPVWSGPGLPALIRVTVTAALEDDPRHPVELTTAVIPGMIPRGGAPPGAAAASATAVTTTTAGAGAGANPGATPITTTTTTTTTITTTTPATTGNALTSATATLPNKNGSAGGEGAP